MPDLTIEARYACESNRDWSTTVELTPGHKYKVTFGRIFGGKYPYGYQCECKAFKYGRGKLCKHIKHVIERNLRCGWDGMYAKRKNGKPICPKCGLPATIYQVGV